MLQAQPLESFKSARRVPDRLRGDMRVARGRAQLGVTKQNLDHPHIRPSLQQMGRKAVTQVVQSGGLVDSHQMFGVIEGPVQLPR